MCVFSLILCQFPEVETNLIHCAKMLTKVGLGTRHLCTFVHLTYFCMLLNLCRSGLTAAN